MKFYSVEGNRQKLDAGAMFGNAPKALWSRWVEVDDSNRMELACRGLLVTDLNGHNVLFETGIGDFFEPKLKQRFGIYESGHVLLKSLAVLGFQPEDIDVVVLSHLHFDHAGGLLTSWQQSQPLELAFPKAQYLVSKTHWQRATHPHPRDRASFIPELHQLLTDSGRLHLVDNAYHDLLGDQVRFEFSEGHTVGLMHSIVDDLVFASDLIPGSAWMHVPISMGYDRFPEQLIDEKSAFLQRHLDANHRLFFTHDPDCCVTNITLENNRYGVKNTIKILKEEV